MAEWLNHEQWFELVRLFGPDDTANKAINAARKLDPEIAELESLRNSFDAEGYARLLWPRVLRALGIIGESGKGEKPGPKELGIPERELWWIIDRRLENGSRASRKWLALETDRREDLTYVPRDRLTPLVDWIDEHPEAARRAAALREIPPGFRAGLIGPVPPSG